jgi:predicted adenylyl cyclase CyaB
MEIWISIRPPIPEAGHEARAVAAPRHGSLASGLMARNVEIKARVVDLETVRRHACALTQAPAEVISQIDTFFVVPKGRLKVRQFADGSGELIAYDRADHAGPKESSYTVASTDDARALCDALGRALHVRGRVVKRRELFLVGRTRVHLDVVEQLGAFVELEVVLRDGEPTEAGEREAHELMRRLGIENECLVPTAYIDLLEQS